MAFRSALCMLAVAPTAADFLQPRRASDCSAEAFCCWWPQHLGAAQCGQCGTEWGNRKYLPGTSCPSSDGRTFETGDRSQCQGTGTWCGGGAAALLANQSQLEQSLTAESYPHISPGGCAGGCDCDWLPTDNCQDKEWCCAGACRDYYHNPAGCSGAALLANQSQLEQSLTAESYPHISPSGCAGGCDCDWLPTDSCQDKEWCCAGACRDYYHNPAACSGAALLANQSQLEQSLTAESYPHINPSGCTGGCDCDWLPNDNCQDKEWCCAGACRDYYHNPAAC